MDNVVGSGGGWYLQIDQRRVVLRDGEFTLGRSRGCGVVLRDPSVSRGHALLCVAGDKATLQDLRSSNGTFVNGRRLEGEVALAAGDRLVLGETELSLFWSGEAAAGSAEEARVFCPACGLPVTGEGERCANCGAALTGQRLPRRSEAIGLGEVLPVGEVLSASSGSWEATRFRRWALEAVADPPLAAGEPPDPIQKLPMSVLEIEGSGEKPLPPPPPPPLAAVEDPAPGGGLLARLRARATAKLRRRSPD